MQTNNKLREALKKCVDELAPFCNGGCRRDEVLEEAKAALAAPLRNCDLYNNHVEAGNEWEKQKYIYLTTKLHFTEWLYAKAKGEKK